MENNTKERKQKRFESENFDQEFPQIPKKPYIFQRIQQNLLNQSLSYNSDDHDEWSEHSDNETENTLTTPKKLCPRTNDYNYNDIDSSVVADENLHEDTNSENGQTKRNNSTLVSEQPEDSNLNITPPTNLHENTNSKNEQTKPHNSTLASEEPEESNANITPPPSFTYSPIVNPIIEHTKKVLAESRKASVKRCLDESDPIIKTKPKQGNARVKCITCAKFFVRIPAHKCKKKISNSLI